MNPIPRNESESDEQFVYTLADRCFAYLERHGEDAGEKLTDEQHTLMAYVFLDSQVQEGGFLQLIATGYGDYVFANPLADSLRRWKIKPTPKILDQAKTLYQLINATARKSKNWPDKEAAWKTYAAATASLKNSTANITKHPKATCRPWPSTLKTNGLNSPTFPNNKAFRPSEIKPIRRHR